MRNTYIVKNYLLHKCVVVLSLFITVTLAHTTPLYVKKMISKNQIAKKSHRKPGHNRVDAEEALRMLREQNPYNQPCIPDFVTDHDPLRIPADLPHMPCPMGTGDRCVEIQLPMHVLVYSSNSGGLGDYHQDELELKMIYVPSGCYENKKPHHPLKATTKNKPKRKKVRNKATSKHHQQKKSIN